MTEQISDFYDPDLFDQEIGDSDGNDVVERYIDFIGCSPTTVVDIGAGTGRITTRLLDANHSVVAIDRSERMIGALRNKTTNLDRDPKQLTVLCSSFGQNPTDQMSKVAIAPDDFLLHFLTLEELGSFFLDARSWLEPAGRLLTNIRPRTLSDLPLNGDPSPVRTFGLQKAQRGFCCVYFSENFDLSSRLLNTSFEYRVSDLDGNIRSSWFRTLTQRLHTEQEVISSAKSAGFELVVEQPNELRVDQRSLASGWYSFVKVAQ